MRTIPPSPSHPRLQRGARLALLAGMHLAALVSCFAQPIITNQPSSQTNVIGSMVTLAVGATGSPPLSYQWKRSSVNVAGATNATLAFTNLQTSNAGNYTVVVWNGEGTNTSTIAYVRVVVGPIITQQPAPTNQSVSIGATVSFTVRATSQFSFTNYQWMLNGADLPRQSNATLVLTNVQLRDAGAYVVVVSNLAGAVTSQVVRLEVDGTFAKITTGAIATQFGTGTGCAWGDYDDDGFIDLLVTSAYDPVTLAVQRNLLYHNNRDGTFSSVTNTLITVEARDWRGCAWVDYDNDGDVDLFVTSTDAGSYASENQLFRNNGNGSFTKMTAVGAGEIVSGGGGSEGAVWADYNRDGFLDAYVVRYGPDWLFRNNGDGTFAKAPNNIGIPLDNFDTYRAMWGDYDSDGWPDLFAPIRVNAGCGQSLLYHGLGGGTFTNLLVGTMPECGNASSGGWADYDNDGHLDLFIYRFGGVASLLYHNNGDGTFTKMASNMVGSIANDTLSAMDCAWGDYDNDGFLDLFLATLWDGSNLTTSSLYRNNGDGTFSRILSGSLVNDALVQGTGCAWGDYDNDGFLDLFVSCGGHTARSTNLLYRNNGNSNAWIKIKLVGTVSNRSAVGAKVRVQANVRGRPMWQLREINTGNGFSASPLETHFGLGDATNIDEMRIEWPSGTVQQLHNVAANQLLTITEPPYLAALLSVTNGLFQMQLMSWAGFTFQIETSSNLTTWTPWMNVTTTSRLTRIEDSSTATGKQRFYRTRNP